MDKEIDLNRFPLYFNIELIEQEVKLWLFKKRPEKALEILENIEFCWLREKGDIISLLRHPKFKHLNEYNMRSLEMLSLEPNESTTEVPDYLACRLNDLVSEVNSIIEKGKENEKTILEVPEKHEKGESNNVKYFLLDYFFTGNSEFKKLKVKDQEKVLGYILSCRADTAKSIKNNAGKFQPDGKHISQVSLERFTDLLEKIKKGETL